MILWGTGDLLAIPDLVSTTGDDTTWGRIMKVLRIISKRDVFVFIVASITVLQLPLVAFLVYAGGTFPTVFGVIVNDLKVAKLRPEQNAS